MQNIATNSERDSIACLATCMKEKAQFHQNPRELTVGKLPLCEKSYIPPHKTLQVHLQQNGHIIPKMCLFHPWDASGSQFFKQQGYVNEMLGWFI